MTAQTKNIKLNKGFTLIELLVVIGILAILLAITLIAINPARQFQQARNTQRQSDANAILNAIGQYTVDQGNNLDTIVPATCTSAAPCTISDNVTGGVGDPFCVELVTEFIAALPVDPQTNNGDPYAEADCTGGAWDTGYQVYRTANDSRVTVTAPATEPAETPNDPTTDITVTR